MAARATYGCVTALAFLVAAFCSGLCAPTGQDTKTNAIASSSEGVSTNPAPRTSVVSQVLKMADAGVSMTVVKAYVEASPAVVQLTEDDIIALKRHRVDDEIVVMLVKRAGETKAATSEARREALEQLVVSRQAASGGFDPESYGYFRYYYLQPRALASAYERLPAYRDFGAVPYGFRSAPLRGYAPSYAVRPGFRGYAGSRRVYR